MVSCICLHHRDLFNYIISSVSLLLLSDVTPIGVGIIM